MLSEIIWGDMKVYVSGFWYSHTWNPVTIIIMDRKQFWNSLYVKWGIIVSGKCINFYFFPYIAFEPGREYYYHWAGKCGMLW